MFPYFGIHMFLEISRFPKFPRFHTIFQYPTIVKIRVYQKTWEDPIVSDPRKIQNIHHKVNIFQNTFDLVGFAYVSMLRNSQNFRSAISRFPRNSKNPHFQLFFHEYPLISSFVLGSAIFWIKNKRNIVVAFLMSDFPKLQNARIPNFQNSICVLY